MPEFSRYDAAGLESLLAARVSPEAQGGVVLRYTCLLSCTALLACQAEKKVVRVKSPCVIHHGEGTTPVAFRAWHRVRGRELMGHRAAMGVVENDCLASQIPPGPTRYVSQSGAELYDEPSPNASSGVRLEGRRAVRVIDEVGGLSLVASETHVLGYVHSIDLSEEARLVEELAIELHWAWERGHRMVVAAQLAALGAQAVRQPPLRDMACRVAFAGLSDPFWVDELGAGDCNERPAFAGSGAGLDVDGTCPSGREVSIASPTLTAWGCVTPSAGAQIWGVDYQGRIEKMGDVVVSRAGACPQARVLGLHTVGLGVCLEAVVSDGGCADATDDLYRALYCLPPPVTPATAGVTEIPIAFRRAGVDDCGGPGVLERDGGQPSYLEDECLPTAPHSGALASFHVARQGDNYLLCVRGAHLEGGPRNVAYEFVPGRVDEMDIWPRVCEVDDRTTWLSTLALVDELELEH